MCHNAFTGRMTHFLTSVSYTHLDVYKRQAYDHEGHAQVKDSDAHAWVEIFDETYGWMPVEVTPAADNLSLIHILCQYFKPLSYGQWFTKRI